MAQDNKARNAGAALAMLALALSPAQAGAADRKAHDHQPLHGGVVVEAKSMDYELVAGPTAIRLYLRDHGKAVDLSGAGAKLTVLDGATTLELDLRPADGRLEATGQFKIGPGARAVAVVTLPGKTPATVRFALKR